MAENTMNVGKAELEMIMLDEKTAAFDKEDAFTWLLKAKVPLEVVTRLEDLWSHTKELGGKVIHLGKIIIFKIIEFIKSNPHTAVGILLGAAVGALVNLVPFIGPILAPITTVIGAAYGGMLGLRLDNPQANTPFEAVIIQAKKFLAGFAELLKILWQHMIG